MVTLKHRRACPEHVGALLGSIAPVDATELGFARVWLSAGLTVSPDDLYHAWLTEKTVVDCPELDIETFDGEILGERRLSIDALWASRLGVSPNPSMTDVTGALAEKLELPPPASRPGRMMLLGFLARALHVLPPGSSIVAREVESALLEALPVNGRDLATVVLDLFRHELPQDGVVNGDLAEVLVQALLSRAAETLLELSSQPG
jgi:hypothetical protein